MRGGRETSLLRISVGPTRFAALASLAFAACGQPSHEVAAPIDASVVDVASVWDATPSPDMTQPVPLAIVREVSGRVEARAQGAERTLKPGDTLFVDDDVHTDADSSVSIGMSGSMVQVHAHSRVWLTEVARHASRLRLSAGRLSAEVTAEGGDELRVEVPRSDATATSRGGRFSAITDGNGALAVASQQGTVELRSEDGVVDVPAGEQSVALPGQPPSPSRIIPASLFLKVGNPPSRVQRANTTVVRGSADPGTVVSIDGKSVTPDARGRFSIVVPLHDGDNLITVDADDASGRHRRTPAGRVRVRRTAPRLDSQLHW